MITQTGFGWNQRPAFTYDRRAMVGIQRAQSHPKPINMSSKVRETVFDTSRYGRD